ncbi:MAG: PEGA domain-containing protein [Chitinispirillaceae bacterium]|nr:PEGA domain-containing protein [Chitinispirillaceae bacterium]
MRYFSFFNVPFMILASAGICASVFAEGTLTVKTDPQGIEVWLGDKFIGQSPVIDKKIRAGRYTLKLVDPAQHTSSSEEILVQDGQPTVVERSIASKFGSLKITSSPQGADVYIATELGKTPVANDFMNPGRYRIEIRPANSWYQTAVTEVSIPKGETVFIDQKLHGKPLLTVRNILSLALMAGAAGGFTWGIIENGHYEKYMAGGAPSSSSADGARLGGTLGIILGASCLIGLEIVTLF